MLWWRKFTILSNRRQWPIYLVQSMVWLLMTRWHKDISSHGFGYIILQYRIVIPKAAVQVSSSTDQIQFHLCLLFYYHRSAICMCTKHLFHTHHIRMRDGYRSVFICNKISECKVQVWYYLIRWWHSVYTTMIYANTQTYLFDNQYTKYARLS